MLGFPGVTRRLDSRSGVRWGMSNKPPNETIDALERLQRLRDSGLLSDEELDQQKAEILRNKRASGGLAPNLADGLSVRPETLKKISEAQRSGGGRGAMWAILAVAVLGVGGYFGFQALNGGIPEFPQIGEAASEEPEPELTASLDEEENAVTIQSKMATITITSVAANKGQCVLRNRPSAEWNAFKIEQRKSLNGEEADFEKLGISGPDRDAVADAIDDFMGFPAVDFPVTLKMGDKLTVAFRNCNVVEADVSSDGWSSSFEF